MISDRQLVARVTGSGDEEAFRLIVERYQAAIRGFLRRLLTGDHGTADDLAQDTFLLAYRKLHTLQSDWELFMDVHDIEPGSDWRRRLAERIAWADCVLVLVGRDWLTLGDGDETIIQGIGDDHGDPSAHEHDHKDLVDQRTQSVGHGVGDVREPDVGRGCRIPRKLDGAHGLVGRLVIAQIDVEARFRFARAQGHGLQNVSALHGHV